MPDFMIRRMPDDLHRKLKKRALEHHRSMNQEALTIIESALGAELHDLEFPPPLDGSESMTADFVNWAKRQGRE